MYLKNKDLEALTQEQLTKIEQEQNKLSGSTKKKSGRKAKWIDGELFTTRINPQDVLYIDDIITNELREKRRAEGDVTYVTRSDAVLYLINLWSTYRTLEMPNIEKKQLEPEAIQVNTKMSSEIMLKINQDIILEMEQRYWAQGGKGRITKRTMIEHLIDCHRTNSN